MDSEITAIGTRFPSHNFLQNPSGQLPFIYLTPFVFPNSDAVLCSRMHETLPWTRNIRWRPNCEPFTDVISRGKSQNLVHVLVHV